ncbi:MAG: hypothetical protein KJ725_00390 [Gammaproteobacteria bacterium]|uniref:VPLPA-CTERM sorting domain-containing protein n=1 Tax=Methylotuvimicrobium sp. TaxID=2822413 RepID=UPI001D2A037F|nr:hypothetical protein [Gammaproteobacteria bacterium]
MIKLTFWVIPFFLLTAPAHADYRDDIGYNQLQSELGINTPDGTGTKVTQVEAAIGAGDFNTGSWMPNTVSTQFTGKTIIDQSFPSSNGISSHATGVAQLFYGNTSSMAPGIIEVDIYSASNWMQSGFLSAGSTLVPSVSGSRIANHSWVGELANAHDVLDILHRIDWLVDEDEFIQVVGVNNGLVQKPLISNAFNVIAVGRTDGQHEKGTMALDSVYASDRSGHDLVVPFGTTSSATAVVSGAAAMLIEQAQIIAEGPAAVISNGDTIYNGERSEVIKAIMMAGADRATQNFHTIAQITDYRADAINQAQNGLDVRFGAGQLNVYNNYQIMDAGQQSNMQDGGAATVDWFGWDYDANFGGAQDSNNIASYRFATSEVGGDQLTVSLVWNINIEDNRRPGFNPSATLHNLDLFLYDVTDGNEDLFASSTSAIDNTENLWVVLDGGRDYELRVVAVDDEDFNWDFALAWRVSSFTPVPLPAGFWFFLTGLLGLVRFRFRSGS